MSFDIVNSNNEPWTLEEYLRGLSYESFIGKRNRDFEKDLKKVVPKITNRELKGSRKQLTQMRNGGLITHRVAN